MPFDINWTWLLIGMALSFFVLPMVQGRLTGAFHKGTVKTTNGMV